MLKFCAGFRQTLRFSSDGKCILVSDYGNSRVCVWDSKSGAQLASIGDGILSSPRDALFAPNGEIVVADNGNSRVCVFSAQGRLLRTFDAASTCSPSVWSCPTALATVHNRLFVMCLNSAVVVVLE